MDAAGRAAKEFGAETRVIRNTSKEDQKEKDPLPFPSVAANGRIVVRNDVVTFEALKAEIAGGAG